MRITRNIYVFIAAVLGCFYSQTASAAGPGLAVSDSGYIELMGTIVHIIGVGPDQETAGKGVGLAVEALKQTEAMMSYHSKGSELSILNRNNAGPPTRISEPLFNVILSAQKYSELTQGAFDITIGPLKDLWIKAEGKNQIPSDKEIQAAKEKTGYEKLIIDPHARTVQFREKGMKLDLGGIAKGYGIDQAVKALMAGNLTGGLVDVGGDIRCFGLNSRGEKGWNIGLQDPFDMGQILMTLLINDNAVATSGDYRRFLIIEGKKQSHILDPSQGGSARGTSSVTIIAPAAMDADALATAVSVMGHEKGIDFIEGIENTDALILTKEEHGTQESMTFGMKEYVK